MIKLIFSVFKPIPGEIQSLNGIRAIGSLTIIFYHYWGVVALLLKEHSEVFRIFVSNLESVMDSFFILSAFLISAGLNYLWEKRKTLDLKNYFWKRTLRIFPAFYIAISLMVLTGYWHIAKMEKNPLHSQSIQFLKEFKDTHSYWIYDALYLSNYSAKRLLPHGWSLSLEEQFYLVLPLFFMFIYLKLEKKTRLVALSFLYFIPCLIRIYNTYYFILDEGNYVKLNFHATHAHADSLLLGILIMELYFNQREIYEKILGYKWLLGIVSIVFLVYVHTIEFSRYSLMYSAFRINLSNIAFGIIFIFALEKSSYLSRFLSLKIFTPFARVSYSTYLYHLTALGMIGSLLFKQGVEPGLDLVIFGFAVSALFAYVFGWVSYIFVEAPFIHLKDYMNQKNKIVLDGTAVAVSAKQETNPAGLDLRFMSSMLDLYIFFPFAVLWIYYRVADKNNMIVNVLLVVSLVVALFFQIKSVVRNGCSVGKKLFYLQVVRSMQDTSTLPATEYIVKRMLLGNIFYLYPPLGILVDVVLINLPGNRTLRDRISKSVVLTRNA